MGSMGYGGRRLGDKTGGVPRRGRPTRGGCTPTHPVRTGDLPFRVVTDDHMAFAIRSVDYYYATVRDELGAAYRVLSKLAELGVNLLAFTAVPSGPDLAQFALFPDDPHKLTAEARAAGLPLDGPHHALLIQGDDELGALANVHDRLIDAGVDIYASSGVTNGEGTFGYLVYVREDQFEKAASTLLP